MKPNKKIQNRKRRQQGIRKVVFGTTERPRLSVFRSNKHIYAQLIDDSKGITIASANDQSVKSGNKSDRAKEVGKMLAEMAKKSKVVTIVFDRSGYKYHGRVKSLADAAREGGLKF